MEQLDRSDKVYAVPYITALLDIESKEGVELTEQEGTFLHVLLTTCPDWLSPINARTVQRMAEKYLGAAYAAELIGQQRLFKE